VCKAVRLLAALARERRPLGAIINDRECGSGLSECAGAGSAAPCAVPVRGGGAVQLALHSARAQRGDVKGDERCAAPGGHGAVARRPQRTRSEEHTSELQSHLNLVCRLLLEKKKKKTKY